VQNTVKKPKKPLKRAKTFKKPLKNLKFPNKGNQMTET